MAELAKPGRDPRQKFEAFSFAEGVSKMEDLQPGLKLPGIVTNVTAFGAFVDIGVHQDGLVHISQLSDRFRKKSRRRGEGRAEGAWSPSSKWTCERKRIALSMKSKPEIGATRGPRNEPGPRNGGGGFKTRETQPANDWFSQAANRRH